MDCPSVNKKSVISRAIIKISIEMFICLLFQLLPDVTWCYLYTVAFATVDLAVQGTAHVGMCVSSSCTQQTPVKYKWLSAAAGELRPGQKLHITYRDYVFYTSLETWADLQSTRAFTCVMLILCNEFVLPQQTHNTRRVFFT